MWWSFYGTRVGYFRHHGSKTTAAGCRQRSVLSGRYYHCSTTSSIAVAIIRNYYKSYYGGISCVKYGTVLEIDQNED
jgi:hypothetical protein